MGRTVQEAGACREGLVCAAFLQSRHSRSGTAGAGLGCGPESWLGLRGNHGQGHAGAQAGEQLTSALLGVGLTTRRYPFQVGVLAIGKLGSVSAQCVVQTLC